MKHTYPTEVGLLAIWDSESLSYIKTMEDYKANFVEDESMVKLMNEGKAVIWGTGGDGHFSITVRIDPEKDLSEEEEKMVDIRSEDCKLVVGSGSIYIGSPEYVGVEDKYLEKKLVQKMEGVEKGSYLVKVYFLYDSEAAEKGDKMSGVEFNKYLEENPDFDKTGYVVVLKKVEDDHNFGEVKEFPQLG
jgi:hypothetical protein